jgi:hypothetical protein
VASVAKPEAAPQVEKKPVAKKPVEKKPVPLVKPALPPAPAPAPAPVAAQYQGKVVSLDRNWGFVVVQSGGGSVRVGDRLYARLADGRRVELVVRRISGNLVSAVPDGKKVSDDLLGAAVSPK